MKFSSLTKYFTANNNNNFIRVLNWIYTYKTDYPLTYNRSKIKNELRRFHRQRMQRRGGLGEERV